MVTFPALIDMNPGHSSESPESPRSPDLVRHLPLADRLCLHFHHFWPGQNRAKRNETESSCVIVVFRLFFSFSFWGLRGCITTVLQFSFTFHAAATLAVESAVLSFWFLVAQSVVNPI